MLFEPNKKSEKTHLTVLQAKPEFEQNGCVKDVLLVYVKGKGILKEQFQYSDDYYIEHQLVLNNIPLLQINSTGCPTCMAMLATGYGAENAECREWEEYQKAATQPFVSLKQSVKQFEQVLTLLQSGLYAIADVRCFPTDGGNRFFWNVPNRFTEYQASAAMWDDYNGYQGEQPLYLYPTQGDACYNKERVNHYLQLYQKTNQLPPILTFAAIGCLSAVLDGHHRACAAALLGIPVRAICIVPLNRTVSYKKENKTIEKYTGAFEICVESAKIPKEYVPTAEKPLKENSFVFANGTLSQRRWEKDYTASVKYYPKMEESGILCAEKMLFCNSVSQQDIEENLAVECPKSYSKAVAMLSSLRIGNDPRLKQAALGCIRICKLKSLREEAYRQLLLLKNKHDEEIEQAFIDYLVESESKDDPFLQVIHQYWE